MPPYICGHLNIWGCPNIWGCQNIWGHQNTWGCPNIWGHINTRDIWTPPKSYNPPMTASKVGTPYLKLTIPSHVLPSYFKNGTAPCCDRFEYGVFTAASTLVVRVCVCSFVVWGTVLLCLFRVLGVLQSIQYKKQPTASAFVILTIFFSSNLILPHYQYPCGFPLAQTNFSLLWHIWKFRNFRWIQEIMVLYKN